LDEQALEEYNAAIKLAPEDGTLYSNRSATNAELGKWAGISSIGWDSHPLVFYALASPDVAE
jgi:hypothetical protein